MTIRELRGPIIDKGAATKYLVVFLHGWGSDGNDLIQIANNWDRQLNNVTFMSPDAPEVCPGNPLGKQWFDILSNDEEVILKGINAAYLDLKSFINMQLKRYSLSSDKYFLVGFSQGTMLAIYASLKEKLLGVVGYSGAFIGKKPEKNFIQNDYIFLHGKEDSIVPIEKMYDATEKLNQVANNVEYRIYDKLEHSINEEGLEEGLNFIKKSNHKKN